MSNELALFKSPQLPDNNEWSVMSQMAAQLVPTGFLPKAIDTPEKAVAIMLKARELNVPAMYGLSNISIINGKPVVSAEMMLALIYRDHGKQAIRVSESSDTACTVEYRLEGWGEAQSYTFTIAQAKTAGLMKNPTWSSYPAAMLRARCISAVARMAFPESIAGMYVPGELGDQVEIDDDGEVRSVNTITGAIIETEPLAIPAEATDDDQLKQEKNKLADIVKSEWGWKTAHLSDAAMFIMDKMVTAMDRKEFETFTGYLDNLTDDQRELIKNGATVEEVLKAALVTV